MHRRPPFALVLIAVVGLFAGALALIAATGGGSSHAPLKIPPPTGSASACVTARAGASATVRSAVRADVSVSVPLTVAVRGAGVSARVSERIVGRAVVSRPVLVRRGAIASARACGHGSSVLAARGAALTRAYKKALVAARARARALAKQSLRSYVAELTPSTRAAARGVALARARAAAGAR